MARCFPKRLEVPGLDLALAERSVDESAPALAIADLRVQFREVPALADLGAKVGDERRARRTVCEVVALAGVTLKVKELVGVGWRVNEFELAAADHHHGRYRAFGQIFADRLVMSARAAEMGREGASVDADPERLRVPACKVDQRRHEIDKRDAGRDTPRLEAAGTRDD